jgi:hypothetical protein
MSIFDLFKKQAPKKTPLEKFEAILAYVKAKEAFLMNSEFQGMDPKEVANKVMYQTMDKAIREKLSEEENRKLDKTNEIKNVLDMLKEEANSGRLSEAEIGEILNSAVFKEYSTVN